MRIKISKKKNPIVEYASGFLSRYLKTHKRQFAVTMLVIYSLLVFLAGILVHKTDVIEEKIKPIIKKKRVFLKHLAIGIFLARPEHITIDIAHKDFQKLEYKRQVALELNNLAVEEDDFVPARIRYNGKNIKVKLRLKGDHTDHFKGDKWSFRIKVKGNETLFGMKVFSIQHPDTRNYLYEWLYHKILKREGLIALRYDFIDVTVNGKDLGIYAIEEFFEKRLIEHNEQREGPIIRFDETIFWEERGMVAKSGSYLSSAIDAFQTTRTLEDPVKRQQFIKAISLLESFRKGDLKAGHAFDLDKLAVFFAVSDLMGAEHAISWINMRFYFNPITARLEPIGFDATCFPISKLCLHSWSDMYASDRSRSVLDNLYIALLSDREFYQKYIKELERVSNPDYLNKFFNETEDELEEKLNIIYKEFPYYNFSKDIYHNNIHIINTTLNPAKILHTYLYKIDTDGIELELGNIQSMDAEVLSVSYKDSIILEPLEKLVFTGKEAIQPVGYKRSKFFFPEGFEWGEDKSVSDLRLNCRIFGATQDRAEDIFPYVHLNRAYIDSDLVRRRPNVEEFEFMAVDDEAKNIIISPGEWTIARNLIIPEGFTVKCSEATKIDLSNEANIISYSPLQFIGTKEEPVIIYSRDSTGQGILVMGGERRSVLKNVIFKNLAAPMQGSGGITGAVTFYESPVEIHGCKFLGNRSEDGLNIIRSEFSIDGTLFGYTFSDAFDGDFTKGTITDSSFIQCKNDGIDLSGSVVEMEDIFIDGAGDKGVSVGESSNVSINEIRIENSNIAMAGKDSSVINITNMNISDCNIGLAAYRKKSEFGPAKVNIDSFSFRDIEKIYLIEKGSKVTVDKVDIRPNEKDVYTLLYEKE